MKRTAFLVLAGFVACLRAASAQPPPAASATVTADAVWQPAPGFVAAAHAACDARPQADYGVCFIDQMRHAGAPEVAAAFAQRLNDLPERGTPGILRALREAGPVDVAFVEFPLRANENQGVLLVNGSPSLIDVDDPANLPMDGLKRIATYRVLARRHPAISLWPGARAGTRFVQVRAVRGGGHRFVLPYVLRNGCHACAVLGSVRIGFDFDADGRLIGTRIVDVRAARRRPVKRRR